MSILKGKYRDHQETIDRFTRIFQQDPAWKSTTAAQRADPAFQSRLLLRSLYAERLKNTLSSNFIFSQQASNAIYAVIGEQTNLYQMPGHYKQLMINKIIKKAYLDFADYPDDF